ncbi:tRNA modification GTPase MnmE [Acrasis kona]|uniref:tRNA modification GTPase MnmE n=1 Tax=Acrasis kona TaxID=1008807 RepID=A0AAW2ZPP9_9EUKA
MSNVLVGKIKHAYGKLLQRKRGMTSKKAHRLSRPSSHTVEKRSEVRVKAILCNPNIQSILLRSEAGDNVDIWNKIQRYKSSSSIDDRKEVSLYVYEKYRFRTEMCQKDLLLNMDVEMYQDDLLDDIESEVEELVEESVNKLFGNINLLWV